MAGFISLYRDIREHWLWEPHRPRTKLEAWIDLIMMANYKPNKVTLGKEVVQVERGTFITSELKLMERWKWSKSKVRAFLQVLENDSMIVKKTDQKKTAITIVNYELYQDSQTEKELQKDHEKTAKKPQKDTTNKENKGNKENKNIYTAEFESWYSSWPRPSAKQDSFKNFEKRRKEHGLEFILMCSKNYLDYFSSLPQKDQGYPYQSNNFFGEKAYYLDFTKAKNKERDAMREIFGDNVILG